MIKCGVCGSENEAAALFCGTCGSPLTPAEATAIAEDATRTVASTTPEPDEAVVPGKGGARRDLGTGGESTTVPDTTTVTPPPETISDVETAPGGPTITCGVCGTINDASRTYCRRCANELKAAPPPPPPPPPPPAARRISPLALGLGAGAVVVAIALIAVLVMGGSKPGATLAPTARASLPTPTSTLAVVLPTTGPTVAPTATARTFTEGALSGQIAFARCASGAKCAIFLRPADSSAKPRRIIGVDKVDALDPAISPDGKTIVYVTEPGLDIVTIASRKYVEHSTGAGDTTPAWSPDGTQITFAGHRDRDKNGTDLEIRIDGLNASSSSRPLTLNDVADHDPVFTPDGLSIVFVQGAGDQSELKMLTIATGDIKALTTDTFADEDPAVSPDGTLLAFASKRGGDGSTFDLFLMDLKTLQITALPARAGNDNDPAWSPGGRYIVFSGGPDGSKDLFILDLSTMKTSTFIKDAGSDIEPSWR